MLPGRGEAFIALVAGISLVAVMLGVAALVIVMSVMNGFRAELFDKIVGLNGHAIIQAYGGRLDNWQDVLKEVKATPGVTRAAPLIEQPLLGSFNGRVEAVLVRGNEDAASIRASATSPIGPDSYPLPPRTEVEIVVSRANLRRCGSTDCEVVGQVEGGTHTAIVVERHDDWSLLSFGDQVGWLFNQLYRPSP